MNEETILFYLRNMIKQGIMTEEDFVNDPKYYINLVVETVNVVDNMFKGN